jgi:molybdopterin-guanine dinucleotide biosynthesis protein A
MTANRKHPICFFATADMYNKVQQIAKYREVSLSHLLRELVRDFLRSDKQERFRVEGAPSNDLGKASTSICTSVSDGS